MNPFISFFFPDIFTTWAIVFSFYLITVFFLLFKSLSSTTENNNLPPTSTTQEGEEFLAMPIFLNKLLQISAEEALLFGEWGE